MFGFFIAAAVIYILEKILSRFSSLNIGPNLSSLKPPPNKLPIGLYECKLVNKRVSTTSANVQHPSKIHPKQLKIAFFGGSACEGYTSERSLSEILAVYLKEYDPKIELFIANYAVSGGSFHRHQARILKSVIDVYDIFIVYAGNNEGITYYMTKGVWSGEPTKDLSYPDSIVLPTIENEKIILNSSFLNDVTEFINTNSRLYAFIFRVISKIISFFEDRKIISDGNASANDSDTSSVGTHKVKRSSYLYPPSFKKDSVIPKEEYPKLIDGYSNDLDEICSLLSQRNKKLIYSNVVTNESSPPFFSVIDDKWSEEDFEYLNSIANQAQNLIESLDFIGAIELISKEIGLDNNMSIFNFQIGTCYKALGELEKSHKYYRNSIDNDGFYFRSTKHFHDAARDVVEKHANAIFVDTISEFQYAIDKGWSWDDLYNDVHHATFAGNAIITRNIFNHLISFCDLSAQNHGEINISEASNFSSEDLEALLATMKITREEIAANKFMSARWHIGMCIAHSSPDYMLERAKNLLDIFGKLLDNDDSYNFALLELYRSMISVKLGEIDEACKQANLAFAKQPKLVKDIMAERGGFVHTLPICKVSELYKDSNLNFSPTNGFFINSDFL